MPTARRRPIGRPRRSSVASRCRRSSWNGSQAEAVRTPPAPGNRTPAAASEDGNRVVLENEVESLPNPKSSCSQTVRTAEGQIVRIRVSSAANR